MNTAAVLPASLLQPFTANISTLARPVASSQAALALAQQLTHPLSLTMVLFFDAKVHHQRREAPLTQVRAEAALTIATDQGFPQF